MTSSAQYSLALSFSEDLQFVLCNYPPDYIPFHGICTRGGDVSANLDRSSSLSWAGCECDLTVA